MKMEEIRVGGIYTDDAGEIREVVVMDDKWGRHEGKYVTYRTVPKNTYKFSYSFLTTQGAFAEWAKSELPAWPVDDLESAGGRKS